MKFKKLFAREKKNRRAMRANGFMLESLEPRLLLSATPMTAAVVTTDHLDYAPGETAIITTSNQAGDGLQFAAGELVRFQVSRTDGMADAASTTADVGPAGNEAWYVIDGIGGFTAYLGSDVSGDGVADWIAPDNDLMVNSSISTTWFVEEQYRHSSLLITAIGQESGSVATQAFTDANLNTTTVVSSSGASTYGDTVTLTATVTLAAGGTTRPVGSVEFFDNGVSIGSTSSAGSGAGSSSTFAIALSNLTAGSHAITAVFTGGANASDSFNNSASGIITQTVSKANAAITVNGYFAEYDGVAHGATGTATGAGGVDLSAWLNLGATFTNVADNIATWTFSGGTNYNDQTGTALIKIVKTDPILTVTGFNSVYSATPPGPVGTVLGLFSSNSPSIPIRDYGTVLELTPTGITNNSVDGLNGLDGFRHVDTFFSADQDVTVTVTGAPATGSGHYFSIFLRTQNPGTGIVNAYYVTYEEAGATGNWWVGRLIDNDRDAPGLSSGTHLANGDKVRATVVGNTIKGYSYHGGLWTEEISYTMTGANVVSGSGHIGLMVSGGSPEVNLTDVTGVFGAAAHGATGTAVGVLGEPLKGLNLSGTVHTEAGTYVDTWTFKDPTGNYHDTFDGIVVSSIAKADATIAVTGYNVVYDGAAHQATGTAVGLLGESLAGLNLNATTHTHVGIYSDTWTFTDTTGNYNDVGGTVNSSINAGTVATATTVSSSSATSIYGDAVTFTATVNAGSGAVAPTGWVEFFDGATSLGVVASPDSAGTGISTWSIGIAGLMAGSHAIHAVYTATGPFLNSTSAYIAQAVSPKSLTGSFTAASKSYDGATAATVLSTTLTGVLAGDVGNITLSGGIADFDTANAGSNKSVTLVGVMLTGAASGNYSLTSVEAATANIAALEVTGNFGAESKVYDGTTAAVVLFTDLTGFLDGDDVFLDFSGATFADANAGVNKTVTLTGATLTGAAAGNYLLTSVATTTADIDQATATVSVSGYSGTYDGAAHGATGSATGVNGEDLSAGLDLGASFTNAPGGTATWSFSHGNYLAESGSVAIVLAKATITFTVTGYFVTYDGNAHTATATATGVTGEDLSAGVNVSGTTHINVGPGSYTDTVTYTDTTGNYTNATKFVKNYITKATALITATSYLVTYDGNAHEAQGTATGVQGENLGGVTGTLRTNAGTYVDTVTYTDTTGNYKHGIKYVKDFIAKATVTLTVSAYSVVYDGQVHQAQGVATGVNGEVLSGLTGSLRTNAGTYTDLVYYTDTTGNYKNAGKFVTDFIAKATVTLTVTGYAVRFDGAAHTATATATGVGGVLLSGVNVSGTTHTALGTYTDTVTFTDVTGNYKSASKLVKNFIL